LAAFTPPGTGIPTLFLTWGELGNNELDAMISTDGVNWYSKLVLPQFPRVYSSVDNHNARGGVGMTASQPCGNVYVAYSDPNNNMYGAKTNSGLGWDGGHFIYYPTYSAPGLRGDNASLPVGFTYLQYVGGPPPYHPSKGKFNCDFSSPSLISGCFFNGSCIFPYDQSGPWSQTWTGANGTTELLGVGQGQDQEIIYQLNSNYVQVPGTNWTNNGLSGAVNPANGTPYIAWTCQAANGACQGTHYINMSMAIREGQRGRFPPPSRSSNHSGCAALISCPAGNPTSVLTYANDSRLQPHIGSQYRRGEQVEALIGPQFTVRGKGATGFAHVLVGGVRSIEGGNHFAGALGGGVDINAGKRVAIRVFQFDYIPNTSGHGSSVRLGLFGIVIKLAQQEPGRR
jgi:hypothetical protein